MSHITIYFDDKPVYLCDKWTPEISGIKQQSNTLYLDTISGDSIKSFLEETDKPGFYAGILYHKNFDKLQKKFFKKFKLIQAGGGLVKNTEDEILLIFRRGVWDLPKGKIDKHETLEECAIREVQEETGLSALKITRKINITYHTYTENEKRYLKESHWYLMLLQKKEQVIPQAEEDITEIAWARKEDLGKYLNNTFPTIHSVLEHA